MKRNYQRELDLITDKISASDKKPRLLIHACCAPCSSYCLEYLQNFFDITVMFYNPNLYPEDEYTKRADEERKLIAEMNRRNIDSEIKLKVENFDSREFYDAIKGLESCPEGGERCSVCFRLRLEKAAEYAKNNGFDFFTTTLTISPLKNADVLNKIGEETAEKFSIKHLPSDFKKKGGYQRSIVLSREFGLYRQNYCGCVFSKRESETSLK